MNYMRAFAISASGMAVEKARVELTAVNLANAQSTRSADGSAVRPLRLVSGPKQTLNFQALLAGAPGIEGVEVKSIVALNTPPRLVYEPGHPDANEKGFVAYPGINPISEMVNLLSATRAYEANVAAMSAAKTMAMKTLEFGS